jgi:hypothetical protein
MKLYVAGENCIMWSFIMRTAHERLLGSNKERQDWQDMQHAWKRTEMQTVGTSED